MSKRALTSLVKDGSKRLATSSRYISSQIVDTGRIRVLNGNASSASEGPVVYWMSRDMRVHDNWALLYAQEQALERSLPLAVVFNLVPKFLDGTIRQFGFLLDGMSQVQKVLSKDYNISFFLLEGDPTSNIPDFVSRNNVSLLVTDFSPMRIGIHWKNKVSEQISIPFHEVDACNVVPPWITSDKIEYAARTIRRKIHDQLDRFLVEFPKMQKHTIDWPSSLEAVQKIDWAAAKDRLECDRTVKEVDWCKAGEENALKTLDQFIHKRLRKFVKDRNDPCKDVSSNLSPYLHFGHICAQTCALQVTKHRDGNKESVDAFIEELIVRKELAENYVFYNHDGYDKLSGLYPQYGNKSWAQITLAEHAQDRREYIYTRERLEKGQTHDKLWNAAQLEMVHLGKMHGFMRMYWAKKILEWTNSPSEALDIAIYLNDRYELDGRDPKGYVGCAWSIAGVHDQGWRERPVFGKIRYMNYQGCQRKFDVDAYVMKISKLK